MYREYMYTYIHSSVGTDPSHSHTPSHLLFGLCHCLHQQRHYLLVVPVYGLLQGSAGGLGGGGEGGRGEGEGGREGRSTIGVEVRRK